MTGPDHFADDVGPPFLEDDVPALPRLCDLPERLWKEALRPLTRLERTACANTVEFERVGSVMALMGELEIEEGPPPGRRRITPPDVPRPDLVRRSPRQVSFRLTEGEHERVTRAARLVALRPAQLARLLVLRGADGLIAEYPDRG